MKKEDKLYQKKNDEKKEIQYYIKSILLILILFVKLCLSKF